MCEALCPASSTKVFRGGDISRAVATDGLRYAGLDKAFVYRKRIVIDCTCNGRDAFELASFDIDRDLTLRAGDVIATQGSQVVVADSTLKKWRTLFRSSIPRWTTTGLSAGWLRNMEVTTVPIFEASSSLGKTAAMIMTQTWCGLIIGRWGDEGISEGKQP